MFKSGTSGYKAWLLPTRRRNSLVYFLTSGKIKKSCNNYPVISFRACTLLLSRLNNKLFSGAGSHWAEYHCVYAAITYNSTTKLDLTPGQVRWSHTPLAIRLYSVEITIYNYLQLHMQ